MLKFLVCCFVGHRKIEYSVLLEQKLTELIEKLIVEFNVGIFLFGSRSEFDNLCYKIVSKLKEKYPYIKKIYVRAEYNYNDSVVSYLLEQYEETYFPKEIENAGKYSYVERNQIMINKSDYCIFYYNKDYQPTMKRRLKKGLNYQSNSGTKLAFNYATKQKKNIFNVYL